jgi:hypothetical protein
MSLFSELNFKRYLFWDIDLSALDTEKHFSFILARVLERGDWDDFNALLDYYGYKRIKKAVTKLRYLDKKTLRFCSFYFNIPLDQFRCYIIRQSTARP